MRKVYVAVGHGVQPNGVFDPGAVAPDGTSSHALNTAVATACAAGLSRSGVDFAWESNAGAGLDPDYRGSVEVINAGHFDAAVEIHHDDDAAPRGGFGVYVSPEGRRLADDIRNEYGAAGLPQRSNYLDSRGLWFLRATNCPAVIWEADNTHCEEPGFSTKAGEAIAHGICDWLGTTYLPVGAPTSHTPLTTDASGMIPMRDHDGYWIVGADGAIYGFGAAAAMYHGNILGRSQARVVGGAATLDDGGYWLVAEDGGVFAFGNAPFCGSAFGARPKPIRSIAGTRTGRGYWLLAADGAVYAFGDAGYMGGAN